MTSVSLDLELGKPSSLPRYRTLRAAGKTSRETDHTSR
jgi:hypothetical protein